MPDDDSLPIVRSLGELADLVRSRPGLHVRFSKGPEHDRGEPSHDYESGLELPGLSTNPLGPERWWTRPIADWLARQLCDYAHLVDDSDDERYAWLLEGTVVARGPDNEPLVADFRPVARLAHHVIDEAKDRYGERFDVADDST